MGEEVCACIRLNEGASITAEKIKEYCKGKVNIDPKNVIIQSTTFLSNEWANKDNGF